MYMYYAYYKLIQYSAFFKFLESGLSILLKKKKKKCRGVKSSPQVQNVLK